MIRPSNARSQWRDVSTYEAETGLSLTVLFTTVAATLEALREAAQLAFQLGAQIRILAAQAVPYPLPLEKPPIDPDFRMRQFYTVCEQESIDTVIDIRLCRDALPCIHQALPPNSLVMIGTSSGMRARWRERRMIRSLRRAGHHVVTV